MSAIQLFRLDDISWDMNYENFCRIRDLFFRYDIRPIIGVIPNNMDPKLKAQVGQTHISQEQFWAEMRDLQQNHGWAIALHGYDHVYVTGDSGMFAINPRAEFAGLPLEEQSEKIRKGKAILESHGLTIDAFMAPAHSLDWNTVEALKQNGIFTVTDGICWYPYEKKGVLFMPQYGTWPHNGRRGVETACFHINSWESFRFEQLERYLRENHASYGSFQAEVARARATGTSGHTLANIWSHGCIRLEKKVRAVGSKVKRKLLSGGK